MLASSRQEGSFLSKSMPFKRNSTISSTEWNTKKAKFRLVRHDDEFAMVLSILSKFFFTKSWILLLTYSVGVLNFGAYVYVAFIVHYTLAASHIQTCEKAFSLNFEYFILLKPSGTQSIGTKTICVREKDAQSVLLQPPNDKNCKRNPVVDCTRSCLCRTAAPVTDWIEAEASYVITQPWKSVIC